ncbi:unnamed protein product [Arabidopsis arenosa]|uniref:F-box domain-containing protein n=1 Tax=Arabidopsis arenosa TaxID=38785 RepID=A0A8S1ZP31_ARAAE|nr:unnamed protein product [Arabidopsis arenosa]
MGDRNYPYASIGLPKLVDALGDGSKTIDSFREPGLEGVPKAKKRKMRTETDSTSNLILYLPTDILATILSRFRSFKDACVLRPVCKDFSSVTNSTDFNLQLCKADSQVFLRAYIKGYRLAYINENELVRNIKSVCYMQSGYSRGHIDSKTKSFGGGGLESRELEIWVIPKWGEHGSWKRLFFIKLFRDAPTCFKPICLMENGELVLICHDSSLLFYNVAERKVRHLRQFRPYGDLQAILHEPNFGSLKDILGVKNLSIRNFKSEAVHVEAISLQEDGAHDLHIREWSYTLLSSRYYGWD